MTALSRCGEEVLPVWIDKLRGLYALVWIDNSGGLARFGFKVFSDGLPDDWPPITRHAAQSPAVNVRHNVGGNSRTDQNRNEFVLISLSKM